MAESGKQVLEQLAEPMGKRLGFSGSNMVRTLEDVVFKAEPNMTAAEKASFIVVCNEYNLNPLLREIYVFRSQQGGIVPLVSIDGWLRIINEHPMFNGMEVVLDGPYAEIDGDHKPCPESVMVSIRRKDRDEPIIVSEYFDECYQPRRGTPPKDGPWQKYPKRMLRHKGIIQAARVAFGFSGISDDLQPPEIDVTPAKQADMQEPKARKVPAEEPAEEAVFSDNVETISQSEATELLRMALRVNAEPTFFIDNFGCEASELPLDQLAEATAALKRLSQA